MKNGFTVNVAFYRGVHHEMYQLGPFSKRTARHLARRIESEAAAQGRASSAFLRYEANDRGETIAFRAADVAGVYLLDADWRTMEREAILARSPALSHLLGGRKGDHEHGLGDEDLDDVGALNEDEAATA